MIDRSRKKGGVRKRMGHPNQGTGGGEVAIVLGMTNPPKKRKMTPKAKPGRCYKRPPERRTGIRSAGSRKRKRIAKKNKEGGGKRREKKVQKGEDSITT